MGQAGAPLDEALLPRRQQGEKADFMALVGE